MTAPDTVTSVKWQKLNRRWWIALACVVVAVTALVISETVLNRTSEACRPVVDLLEFNQAQADQIAQHTDDSAELPTVADDVAYQQWADGMAQRAQAVTDPDLAGSAIRAADLAAQFVAKLPSLRAEADAYTPGAPTPALVHEMNFLNARLSQEITELNNACVN
ncbi:MAG: hypothetical protein WBB07_10205 [Mycobacterium sp.]